MDTSLAIEREGGGILTYLEGVLTSAPFSINCAARSLFPLCIANSSGVMLSYSVKDISISLFYVVSITNYDRIKAIYLISLAK